MTRQSKAPTQRQQRVSEEIRVVLGNMFMRDETFIRGLKSSYLMITGVEISPDLSIADIAVRGVGSVDTVEQVALLNVHKGAFRHQVGKKIRLRIVPDLRFHVDKTFDDVAHMMNLLSSDVVRKDVEKYKDEE